MSEAQADTASVIHRKAKVARDGFDAREMSPAKALRLALAKAADAQFELALVVRMVEHVALPLSEVEAAAGEEGLLILLDGAAGPPGAIKLDMQFVMALIEAQLMGEVRKGEAMPRPFTPTDAAIVQPLMNAVLEGYAAQMNACETVRDVELFRFGDRVEDGRTLALALSAPDYDLYRLNVDFGPGAKTGVMELFLPEPPPEPQSEDDGALGGLAAKLEENAMNAPVMLDAVLAPLRLPLNEVCGWTPGMVLPLSAEVVRGARIVGAKRHEVARARLGQLNGFRAVRMAVKTQNEDDTALPDEAREAGAARLRAEAAPAAQDGKAGGRAAALQDVPDAEVEPPADAAGGPLAAEDRTQPAAPEPSEAELDALVEEELARASARFGEDADMPLTGGATLGAPALE